MSENESEMNYRSVRFNNNSYLSISIVVILIGATIWIKDGQARNEQVSMKAADELKYYKELQAKDAEIVKGKLDALQKLVELGTQDRYTGRDARTSWKQFKALNPTLLIPEFNVTP